MLARLYQTLGRNQVDIWLWEAGTRPIISRWWAFWWLSGLGQFILVPFGDIQLVVQLILVVISLQIRCIKMAKRH